MSIPIVPAIIPQSLEHLRQTIASVSFSREVQIDLVDGRFVKPISWPYEPAGEPMDIKAELDRFTLEIDLMVSEPLVAAEEWLKAGADMLIFHVESLSLHDFEAFAVDCPVTIGVAGHGETTVETIAKYAVQADYIQLMGIKEIGAQGQPFDESVLEKVSALRTQFPDYVIAVDGSVNQATIGPLRQAGVNRMVAGSALVGQADPQQAYNELVALIN
jgi:ribulose-phosphate 3-epimerase